MCPYNSLQARFTVKSWKIIVFLLILINSFSRWTDDQGHAEFAARWRHCPPVTLGRAEARDERGAGGDPRPLHQPLRRHSETVREHHEGNRRVKKGIQNAPAL